MSTQTLPDLSGVTGQVIRPGDASSDKARMVCLLIRYPAEFERKLRCRQRRESTRSG